MWPSMPGAKNETGLVSCFSSGERCEICSKRCSPAASRPLPYIGGIGIPPVGCWQTLSGALAVFVGKANA